jgi:hypothetical protein
MFTIKLSSGFKGVRVGTRLGGIIGASCRPLQTLLQGK